MNWNYLHLVEKKKKSSQCDNCGVHSLCLSTAPCEADAFFCHSNMCINNTLVCNGMQNCVYPWDENQCKGEMFTFQSGSLRSMEGRCREILCLNVSGPRRASWLHCSMSQSNLTLILQSLLLLLFYLQLVLQRFKNMLFLIVYILNHFSLRSLLSECFMGLNSHSQQVTQLACWEWQIARVENIWRKQNICTGLCRETA